MGDFLMPSLGADMQAGTLVVWRKQPGESIKRGEILAEVETDKGIIEVESFLEGTVASHLVSPGNKVPVGTRLAVVNESVQAPRAPATAPPPLAQVSPAQLPPPLVAPLARATPAARRALRETLVAPEDVRGTGPHGVITRADVLRAGPRAEPLTPLLEPPAPPERAGAPAAPLASPAATTVRLRVSPRARRMAVERGISLAGLAGTGPGGSIVAQDVELALKAQPSAPASSASARMRSAIAQAVSRSKREIPHYYLTHTIDLAAAVSWLAEQNAKRTVVDRLLIGILFVRAVALAVRQVPELNAHHGAEGLQVFEHVHVGLAVSLRGGGLIAPALMNAHQGSLDELATRFKDLVNRARSGRVTSSEMGSATLTITSLGERGVETVFPVIVPPQVAMVGFGAVLEKPMVVRGALLARPTVVASLAGDHRVSDGHRGGLYLSAVAALLQEPDKL